MPSIHHTPVFFPRFLCAVLIFFISAASWMQIRAADRPERTAAQPKSLLAYVFDERFSVVRSRPDVEAAYLRRLRTGHRVFIVSNENLRKNEKFRRVIVSSRFVGWMLNAALAAPGIPGDDEKLFRFAMQQPGERALIALKILTSHFEKSSLRPKALLQLGTLADQVAFQISNRANRKLNPEELKLPEGLDETDLFANYRGLDHFESFGIHFRYQAVSDQFAYSGDAYRELIRRYPKAGETVAAKERLRDIRVQPGGVKPDRSTP
ncbi:MAG: hypothetical protein PHX83_11110 [Acidobacteriia bacterium]|nr:hypothetical protein [Terriglobia bacterium]